MKAITDYGLELEVRRADEVILNYFPKCEYFVDTRCGVIVLEKTKSNSTGTKYKIGDEEYSGCFANKYNDLLKSYMKKVKNVQISLF